MPSGEVGGDLVDLVDAGTSWTAYVADVSGHGVAPGVLMAMFKTAVRTRIPAGCDAEHLLEGVHQALYPLKTSNMFVTAGFIHFEDDQLSLSLAGHPALLHFQALAAETSEYEAPNLPVGILPEQHCTARILDCKPGDILLLLTDGMTEVFDNHAAEMGAEPIKRGLLQGADLPLPELFRRLREVALRHGKQEDDQSMLLIRMQQSVRTFPERPLSTQDRYFAKSRVGDPGFRRSEHTLLKSHDICGGGGKAAGEGNS